MENSPEILKQLKLIKWLLLFTALSAVVGATSIAYSAYASAQYMKSFSSDKSSCSSNSFRREINPLIDSGELDKAIEVGTAHIAKFPSDTDGYWFRGKAYYQQEKWQLAIDDFKTTEKLSPSWKDEYTDPYIKEAEKQLMSSNKSQQH